MNNYMYDTTGLSFQPEIVNTLTNEIAKESLSHAYLFVGPPGVGKKTLATKFAFTILSTDNQNSIFNYNNLEHPDFLLLQRSEGKSVISKTQISDELIPWIYFKPYYSKKKVAVIFDAHLLSIEGANALLKTLEDPPEYAVLILVSNQEDLLETIVSRCRKICFSKLSDETISHFLAMQENAPLKEQISEITHISHGNAKIALSVTPLTSALLKTKAINYLQEMSLGHRSAIFFLAKDLENEGKVLYYYLWMFTRDIVLYNKIGKKSPYLEEFPSLPLTTVSIKKISALFEDIQKFFSYEEKNVNKSAIALNISFAFYHCFQ